MGKNHRCLPQPSLVGRARSPTLAPSCRAAHSCRPRSLARAGHARANAARSGRCARTGPAQALSCACSLEHAGHAQQRRPPALTCSAARRRRPHSAGPLARTGPARSRRCDRLPATVARQRGGARPPAASLACWPQRGRDSCVLLFPMPQLVCDHSYASLLWLFVHWWVEIEWRESTREKGRDKGERKKTKIYYSKTLPLCDIDIVSI